MSYQPLPRFFRLPASKRAFVGVGYPLKLMSTVLTVGLLATPAQGSPYQFSYSGRLANTFGEAVRGPVDLELKFYRDAAGGAPVPVSPIVKRGVTLADGVFQVDLSELTPGESHLVFAPNVATWVEVTDTTNRTAYPRQRLTAVPYAFKVPVDQSAITFDTDGRLTVNSLPMSKVAGLEAAIAQKTDSSRPVYASGIQGKDVTATPPAPGQALVFNGSSWAPQTISAGGSGTVTSVSATLPFTVSNGTTTPALSMAPASSTSPGYLTSTDWATFNGKASQAALDTLGDQVFKKDGSVIMTGNLTLSPEKSLQLGTFTTAQETTLVAGLVAGGTTNKGKTWYNSDTNLMRFFDGTIAQSLGVAGAGITSLNGLTGGSQTFAFGTSGTAPAFSSSGSTHTLNIPMASATSVAAGLISKSDYDSFTGKVGSIVGDGTGLSVSTSGGTVTVGLNNSGVTAASYNRANITVNAQGRVTTAWGGPIDLATEVSGTLSVGRGGTGMSSGTAYGVPYFNSGATSMTTTAAGTSSQVLVANGAGEPTFGQVNLASSSAVTGILPESLGGTGFTSLGAARTTMGAAESGNNSDITSLMAGNIGVGTSSPAYKLHVSGAGASLVFVQATTGNSEIKLGTSSYYGYLSLDNTNGSLAVKSGPGVPISIAPNGTEAMVVKPDGKVGIGTSNPTGNLSFGGTVPKMLNVERNISATAGSSLTIKSGGAGSGSNINGGDLILASGIATGTGSSKIDFQAVPPGNTGMVDQIPVSRMTVHGTGVSMNGSVSVKTVVISTGSAYTVLPDDVIIIITSTSTFTVNLMSCTTQMVGRLLTIANRSASAATISVSPSIAGTYSLGSPGTAVRLVCDGIDKWQAI